MKQDPTPLPTELRGALKGMASKRTYPKGGTLFRNGQPPSGLYVIETGEVNLFLPSRIGTGPVFETVRPGELLGLSEAVSGENHKLRAEAACRSEIYYVSRDSLLQFLRQNQVCCMQIVRLLSEELHLLYHRFRLAKGGARRRKRSTISSSARRQTTPSRAHS